MTAVVETPPKWSDRFRTMQEERNKNAEKAREEALKSIKKYHEETMKQLQKRQAEEEAKMKVQKKD